MAESIALGIRSVSPETTVTLYNASRSDKNDIATEVFASKAVVMGSPTINNGYSYAIGGELELIKGLKFKGKKYASFGSYGWSGEAANQISEALAGMGYEKIADPLRVKWAPDEDALAQCVEYGKTIAEAIK